jgi:hypothetical protein
MKELLFDFVLLTKLLNLSASDDADGLLKGNKNGIRETSSRRQD